MGPNLLTQVEPGKANVLVVVGTRPEAIKMLPVIERMRDSPFLRPVVISTGQHARMVAEVLDLANERADIDLAAASPRTTLCGLWANIVSRLESVLIERFSVDGTARRSRDDIWGAGFPAAMLVHGDTTSAVAAAVAGFQLRIPVVHVEAGLRTHSPSSPFPEEMNRQLIDRLSAFHLAPTSVNKENLVREGIPFETVFVTGNTAIDALYLALRHEPEFDDPVLADIVTSDRPVVVVTAHRRENWGEGITNIANGVAAAAAQHLDAWFVVVTHPNPTVRSSVRSSLEGLGNVHLTGALDYVGFAHLLDRASFAVSDSGGIQEEAPSLGTPVLVTRSSTERQEGVQAGTLEVVGTDPGTIRHHITRLLEHPDELDAMAAQRNPYGDGHAAERIVAALEHLAGFGPEPTRYGSGYRRDTVLAVSGYPTDRRPPSQDERLAIAHDWLFQEDD
jgi:UDP-N-acetylglucosamine 2-epimerase (non-hydrolysing)